MARAFFLLIVCWSMFFAGVAAASGQSMVVVVATAVVASGVILIEPSAVSRRGRHMSDAADVERRERKGEPMDPYQLPKPKKSKSRLVAHATKVLDKVFADTPRADVAALRLEVAGLRKEIAELRGVIDAARSAWRE